MPDDRTLLEAGMKPVACAVMQALNFAVLRSMWFIPTEPRVPGPVTSSYKQWLAAVGERMEG